jgi:prepilin-type N-terminal cleavage/methylation domain-containing protein
MNKNLRQRGFTLIELLIVIVIIGILSGVLIAVINPVRQQNRSRNATIKASVNKAAFAIQTARAGIGRMPSNEDLGIELENFNYETDGLCDDDSATTLNCTFSIAGSSLPSTCTDEGNNYTGVGDVECFFYVLADGGTNPGDNLDSNQFILVAKKWQLDPANDPHEVYVYSAREGFFECPVASFDEEEALEQITDDGTNGIEGCDPVEN